MSKTIELSSPKPRITVIHPSRNRPELCRQVAAKWLSSAKDPSNVWYIVSLDSDDPMLTAYNLALRTVTTGMYEVNLTVNPNGSAIQAINKAAEIAAPDTEIFVVVSDDFDCPFHWDEGLLQSVEGKVDWIAKTDDGLQPWIITLPIMDIAYYHRFGYIYHPDFLHLFCDTEMTHVADLLDRKITLPIKFPHNHYSTGRTKKDNISIKNDSTWAQGETMYLNHMSNNFGLIDPPGELRCDAAHYEWIKNKSKTYLA
jgi:hypothetical protein